MRGECVPVELVCQLKVTGIDFGFIHFEVNIIEGLPIENDAI